MNKQKRNSIIFIIIVIAICIISGIFVYLNRPQGNQVVVSINGQEYGKYDIHKDQTIKIEQDGEYNIIEIKDGVVDMIESTCDNQICVYDMPISEEYPSVIVCLPHGLIVEIKDQNNQGVSNY